MSSLFDGRSELQPPYHVVQIVRTDTYRDGGSLHVELIINTVKAVVCRDGRINSTTKGIWYDRYPERQGAVPLPEELVTKLIMLLDSYENLNKCRRC
jgi:hypothetical protein